MTADSINLKNVENSRAFAKYVSEQLSDYISCLSGFGGFEDPFGYELAGMCDWIARVIRYCSSLMEEQDHLAARKYFSEVILDGSDEYLGDLVPVDPKIDRNVFLYLRHQSAGLNMLLWHGEKDPTKWCGTTHCRAGAAIASQGEKGVALEAAFGPLIAGSLIYAVGRRKAGLDTTIPNFYDCTDDAWKDIVACKRLNSDL
jgi:hypothetical protein